MKTPDRAFQRLIRRFRMVTIHADSVLNALYGEPFATNNHFLVLFIMEAIRTIVYLRFCTFVFQALC